jgi:hypothetical protein
MRTLALLLILANALFFIWSQTIDVQVSALDRAPAASADPPPRIVLAREVAQDESDAEPPAGIRDVTPPNVEPLQSGAEAQVARADSLACTSVGPFSDLPQAAQAQAALRTAGYQPRQRVEQGELWVGYWVSVPNLATRAAAEAAMETLNDNGVTDVYLMPESEPTHVVSLGVFSDYQRAQRRANQVRALGLAPRISDRRREGSVYWLDVDLREPGEILDASVFQTGEARIMRLEMRACPADRAG